ncbi:HEAT repeat domain-containing protein [bacterium]|nr:HEAT repeat domain-containing protein [Gemmataceae bacterium]NBS89869.1 HEAT repeat domain-containing protein [bacterium]NBT62163.1 HEAT repeat domain-containing protein [Planctomycetia bacterium]
MVVPKHFKAVAALLILGMLTHALMAFQEEPVFQGKKFSEWETMLKVDSNYSKLSDAEKEKSSRSRRAGLIALELMASSLDKRILPSMVLVLKNDPEEKLRETAALSLTRVALKMSEKTKSASTRQYAAEVLKESLEKDKSIRVKEIAASSLGKMVPESAPAIPALILAMKQKDTGLRVAAVDALRRLGPEAKDAAPDLRALASDSTADIISKSFAFLALGNLKDGAAIPVLLQTVQDAKMPLELRLPAANAISMMGGEAGGAFAEKLGLLLIEEGTPKDLKIALSITLDSQESFAYPAWKSMVPALKDRDAAVRSIILHCLGNIGVKLQKDFKVVQAAVLGCVNDSALEVRLAAVETLGRWGPELSDDEVVKKVESLTKDTAKEMRETAATVLKRLKGTPSN